MRSHHAEFYGETEAPAGDIALVVGNCQAESLRIVLEGAGLATVRVPPVHELTAHDLPFLGGWLENVRILVSQPIRDGYRGLPVGSAQLAARLPGGGRALRVPVIRFAGLYPTHAIVRPPHDRSAVPPIVEYHDLRVLTEAAGRRLPRLSPSSVQAIAELSRRELQARELAHRTVRVSDLFGAPSFAQMRTLNHPGNPVWNAIAARVRHALGLPDHHGDPGRPLADAVHAPRESVVIEAFGLPDGPAADWIVDGEPVTAAAVREAHLGWYAKHPDAVDAGLARHAKALGILAAAPRPAARQRQRRPAMYAGGPPRHGVVRHAREVAAALGAATTELDGAGPLHVHVTDTLWGSSPESAAARLEALAGRRRLTVTLHDLPQPADGPRSHPRRSAAYARIARAAAGVVVSSEHERALLGALCTVQATVIPLPVMPLAAPAASTALDDQVAVLGFFYPGKGHAEVIAATPRGLGVSVLGAVSPGHEADLADLLAAAPVEVTVTGWLDEAELLARCRRAAVPVAAHQHLSASGSIGSWIAAGRRPIVPDTPATRELDALRPGTITRADDLAEAILAARLAPATTWIASGTDTRPHLRDTAAAYRAWWVP